MSAELVESVTALVQLVRASNSRAKEAEAALADLRAAVEELLAASERDGRGGVWVHNAYLRALLSQQTDGGAS